MNYVMQAFEETWGDHKPVREPEEFPTYADLKMFICQCIDLTVQGLHRRNPRGQIRVRTVEEIPGEVFDTVIEWCATGELAPEDETRSQWSNSDYGLQEAVLIKDFRATK